MTWHNEECFKTGRKLSIVNGKPYLDNAILKMAHIKLSQQLIMKLSDDKNTAYHNVTKPAWYTRFYNQWYFGEWDFIEVRLVNLGDCK